MERRAIVISDADEKRLKALIRRAEQSGSNDKSVLEKLEAALRGAVLLRPSKIPNDVVTINSCVRLLDIDSGQEEEVWLRLASDKEALQSCPVLSDLGVTLLGNKLGDVVEWSGSTGRRRSKIIEIVYQPERLGNYEV
jgi:regulator of nucleoside diphosphate kinase